MYSPSSRDDSKDSHICDANACKNASKNSNTVNHAEMHQWSPLHLSSRQSVDSEENADKDTLTSTACGPISASPSGSTEAFTLARLPMHAHGHTLDNAEAHVRETPIALWLSALTSHAASSTGLELNTGLDADVSGDLRVMPALRMRVRESSRHAGELVERDGRRRTGISAGHSRWSERAPWCVHVEETQSSGVNSEASPPLSSGSDVVSYKDGLGHGGAHIDHSMSEGGSPTTLAVRMAQLIGLRPYDMHDILQVQQSRASDLLSACPSGRLAAELQEGESVTSSPIFSEQQPSVAGFPRTPSSRDTSPCEVLRQAPLLLMISHADAGSDTGNRRSRAPASDDKKPELLRDTSATHTTSPLLTPSPLGNNSPDNASPLSADSSSSPEHTMRVSRTSKYARPTLMGDHATGFRATRAMSASSTFLPQSVKIAYDGTRRGAADDDRMDPGQPHLHRATPARSRTFSIFQPMFGRSLSSAGLREMGAVKRTTNRTTFIHASVSGVEDVGEGTDSDVESDGCEECEQLQEAGWDVCRGSCTHAGLNDRTRRSGALARSAQTRVEDEDEDVLCDCEEGRAKGLFVCSRGALCPECSHHGRHREAWRAQEQMAHGDSAKNATEKASEKVNSHYFFPPSAGSEHQPVMFVNGAFASTAPSHRPISSYTRAISHGRRHRHLPTAINYERLLEPVRQLLEASMDANAPVPAAALGEPTKLAERAVGPSTSALQAPHAPQTVPPATGTLVASAACLRQPSPISVGTSSHMAPVWWPGSQLSPSPSVTSVTSGPGSALALEPYQQRPWPQMPPSSPEGRLYGAGAGASNMMWRAQAPGHVVGLPPIALATPTPAAPTHLPPLGPAVSTESFYSSQPPQVRKPLQWVAGTPVPSPPLSPPLSQAPQPLVRPLPGTVPTQLRAQQQGLPPLPRAHPREAPPHTYTPAQPHVVPSPSSSFPLSQLPSPSGSLADIQSSPLLATTQQHSPAPEPLGVPMHAAAPQEQPTSADAMSSIAASDAPVTAHSKEKGAEISALGRTSNSNSAGGEGTSGVAPRKSTMLVRSATQPEGKRGKARARRRDLSVSWAPQLREAAPETVAGSNMATGSALATVEAQAEAELPPRAAAVDAAAAHPQSEVRVGHSNKDTSYKQHVHPSQERTEAAASTLTARPSPRPGGVRTAVDGGLLPSDAQQATASAPPSPTSGSRERAAWVEDASEHLSPQLPELAVYASPDDLTLSPLSTNTSTFSTTPATTSKATSTPSLVSTTSLATDMAQAQVEVAEDTDTGGTPATTVTITSADIKTRPSSPPDLYIMPENAAQTANQERAAGEVETGIGNRARTLPPERTEEEQLAAVPPYPQRPRPMKSPGSPYSPSAVRLQAQIDAIIRAVARACAPPSPETDMNDLKQRGLIPEPSCNGYIVTRAKGYSGRSISGRGGLPRLRAAAEYAEVRAALPPQLRASLVTERIRTPKGTPEHISPQAQPPAQQLPALPSNLSGLLLPTLPSTAIAPSPTTTMAPRGQAFSPTPTRARTYAASPSSEGQARARFMGLPVHVHPPVRNAEHTQLEPLPRDWGYWPDPQTGVHICIHAPSDVPVPHTCSHHAPPPPPPRWDFNAATTATQNGRLGTPAGSSTDSSAQRPHAGNTEPKANPGPIHQEAVEEMLMRSPVRPTEPPSTSTSTSTDTDSIIPLATKDMPLLQRQRPRTVSPGGVAAHDSKEMAKEAIGRTKPDARGRTRIEEDDVKLSRAEARWATANSRELKTQPAPAATLRRPLPAYMPAHVFMLRPESPSTVPRQQPPNYGVSGPQASEHAALPSTATKDTTASVSTLSKDIKGRSTQPKRSAPPRAHPLMSYLPRGGASYATPAEPTTAAESSMPTAKGPPLAAQNARFVASEVEPAREQAVAPARALPPKQLPRTPSGAPARQARERYTAPRLPTRQLPLHISASEAPLQPSASGYSLSSSAAAEAYPARYDSPYDGHQVDTDEAASLDHYDLSALRGARGEGRGLQHAHEDYYGPVRRWHDAPTTANSHSGLADRDYPAQVTANYHYRPRKSALRRIAEPTMDEYSGDSAEPSQAEPEAYEYSLPSIRRLHTLPAEGHDHTTGAHAAAAPPATQYPIAAYGPRCAPADEVCVRRRAHVAYAPTGAAIHRINVESGRQQHTLATSPLSSPPSSPSPSPSPPSPSPPPSLFSHLSAHSPRRRFENYSFSQLCRHTRESGGEWQGDEQAKEAADEVAAEAVRDIVRGVSAGTKRLVRSLSRSAVGGLVRAVSRGDLGGLARVLSQGVLGTNAEEETPAMLTEKQTQESSREAGTSRNNARLNSRQHESHARVPLLKVQHEKEESKNQLRNR